MEYLYTTDHEWLEKWDDFVSNDPKGNHLAYSDWLRSYQAYGFDFELILMLDEKKIIGGCGMIIPRFLFFKFCIVPHGPVLKTEFVHLFDDLVAVAVSRSKKLRTCYFQFSIPISSNSKIDQFCYSLHFSDRMKKGILKSGKLFNHIYTTYGLNWVDFGDYQDADAYLAQLTPKVRRNIRMPYNKNANPRFVSDVITIQKGYEVIMENAVQGGYSVRSFEEFKDTITQLIKNNRGYFIVCEVDNTVKAAAFFIKTKYYITNIMGGVLREKPDIKLGYMIQWEIIKKSFELGMRGYNISMGGSEGVQEFKNRFDAEPIRFDNPNYYLVNNKLAFGLFRLFDKHLRNYKGQISKLLRQ